MRFVGFIGPSYTLQSVNVDCQRTVNLYPEINELGTGKESEVASLVSTPGLRELVELSTGPVRGTFTDSTGQLWAVGGNTLYKISDLWVATSVGTLNTSSGRVSFADNGIQVVLVDGPYGYYYTIATEVFAQITDADFLGATQVEYMDGYFIFIKPDSKQFYISELNSINIDGADIASAEASPDDLVGQVVVQENLYLFGSQSTEVFYDSGAADFPFERISGAVIEIGCESEDTIGKIGNAVYWLGRDKNGRGVVYRAQGLQPLRISTLAIENKLRSLGDLSGASAWTYQQGGHSFYCLNVPGADSTWVFDVTTNLWHERAHFEAGAYQRHLADCHALAYHTNVVGDYSSGKLYALDPDTYTDNGDAILRERTAPHLSKSGKRIFHGSFQLDMETGVGIDGTGQGVDPKVMLQWSDDGGHTWSNEHWTDIGARGVRSTRAIWRRLGSARDRVYRVRISDPVKVTITGAEIEIQEGGS